MVVLPLDDEKALRYQAWVAGRRAATHELSGGRVGYLHIPDMVANGWAQLHRDLILEIAREGLVVDVRDNNGGHTSELVLEKLARTVQGWDNPRGNPAVTYPANAPRGPIVAVTNQHAGSDGDIVTAASRCTGSVRWSAPAPGAASSASTGGYTLVDGTSVTQPAVRVLVRTAPAGASRTTASTRTSRSTSPRRTGPPTGIRSWRPPSGWCSRRWRPARRRARPTGPAGRPEGRRSCRHGPGPSGSQR